MICIVDFGSKKTPDIKLLLNQLGCKNRILSWHQVKKSSFKNADGIILSGAPILLTEVDHLLYVNPFAFLKDIAIPLLGICFGHQLIGLVYGAKVAKGDAIRELTAIELIHEDVLFKGIATSARFMEDHTEGITLPHEFICLANSKMYEVEAMKHITKPIYGVQFHPEVSGKNGEKLLRNWVALLALLPMKTNE